MSAPDFVHLHVHSEYSLLDGANRIEDLVKACRKDGQTALALTDHGNMFGAIELYQECTSAGIKPIIGCEVYIARQSRLKPHSKRKGNGYNHLTLLARNREGLDNLIKLASIAYLEGYHFRPRIDKEVLAAHTAGINCLSGCLAGELNQLFLMDKEAEAERLAGDLREMFGPEHFWLELQRNGIEIQTKANECIVRLGQRTGIPMVATNDVHYLRQEDCHAQDVLLCINTGAKRKDENRFKFETDTLFFKSRTEMAEMFRDLPETLKSTVDVAEQTGVEIEFGKYHVPVFKSDSGEDPELLFDRLLEEGLERIYGRDSSAARERLEYEKGIIRELGFVSYFLIVWDLIRWARENRIPVGPGRGSAAGSIVAYLLDITRVCPLEYNLLFERFLNSARVSMPDIDIDFCKEGRERVLQYTRDRYGTEHVAQIVTFGTMASRTVIRDVGRVLDIPLKDVDGIAKKVPAGPGAPPLAKALESDQDLIALRKQRPELEELFTLSKSLEGLSRHVSTHAAGVVIADRPIVDYVPLAKNGEDITTQWPMTQLEELGLLKMDYLGLRTLTILQRCLDSIARQAGEPPELTDLPLGDPATYSLLMAGDTLGVFQLESDGMRKLLARIKPDCFGDLIAVLALYRPGPLESGMAETFIRRKHGEEQIVYPHETLEPILSDTYGCLVYQEQVMLISNHLAKFSLNEADNLRKAMGKKKPEIMQKFAAKFIEGAVANGCDKKTAEETWSNMVKFGGYGFNKSHSTAYALITYQTAYMKANYRTAFVAANLSCEMGDSGKVKELVDDATLAGIAILPPDIACSGWEFEPCEDRIRFGFGAVKGTGSKAIESLIAARDQLRAEGLELSLHALCSALDPAQVGKLTFEAIIKAGCFDSSGHNRGAVLAALEGALADGTRAAENRRAGQGALFGAAQPLDPGESSDGIDDSKAIDEAATLSVEYEVLGFYLSGHPLEGRSGLVSLLSSCPTRELASQSTNVEITLAGLVLNKSETLVKTGRMAGQKMARFRLEDLTGQVPVICFPRAYEECRDLIEDGQIIVCRGKLEESSEEPSVILEEVMDLEQALPRFSGGVLIQVGPHDDSQLQPLMGILGRHRGPQPVYLQVTGNDGFTRRVRAGKDHNVTVSEDFAREVDGLLGRGRVRLARV